jgi:SAM-dependent methyltransferase
MTGEADWVPPGVDTRRANIARVYDYWLGGDQNFQADQDLARQITAVEPTAREIATANRAFLGRAVRFVTGAGIRQFLDIGSGIPTQGNVHEAAQAADPAARVVYADLDPVVVAHSEAILAHNASAAAISADLRDPEAILADPTVRRLIDFGQPVAVLLVAVLHFLSDSEDPWRVVRTLRDRLAPGSYLVMSHAAADTRPEMARRIEKVYNRSVAGSWLFRSDAEIARFFDGFELVEPGLVPAHLWRPDPGTEPADPARLWAPLAGVGRKP